MRRYAVLSFFWVPEENAAKRTKTDRVPYQEWIDAGYITATPGNTIDYDRIRSRVNELSERFNIKEIAIDRWNAQQLSTQLSSDGFTVILCNQHMSTMAAPSKAFDTLVRQRAFLHNDNPVMRWMASNLSVVQDASGNIRPDKEKSTEKIDGIVAAILAVGRASVHTDAGSVYETRGVFKL